MKKPLLAIAILGAFSGAHAQSSLNIYGTFSGGVRYLDNVNAAGDSRTSIGSIGLYQPNRLGFQGVEDLGGGMKARFNLETGFNTGTGALDNTTGRLFNRTASAGVGGGWGWLDFGHQYTVAFRTNVGYDPLRLKFNDMTGQLQSTGASRFDNAIQYTGTFGPMTVRAEHALGETPGSASTNAASAAGLSYTSGPLHVGGAYTARNNAGLDVKHFTAGAAYTLGKMRIAGGHAQQKAENTAAPDTETKWTFAGVNYSITPALEVSGSFYRTKVTGTTAVTGKRDHLILVATYALSKRTVLFAEVDRANLDGALRIGGVQTGQNGMSVGMNVAF